MTEFLTKFGEKFKIRCLRAVLLKQKIESYCLSNANSNFVSCLRTNSSVSLEVRIAPSDPRCREEHAIFADKKGSSKKQQHRR